MCFMEVVNAFYRKLNMQRISAKFTCLLMNKEKKNQLCVCSDLQRVQDDPHFSLKVIQVLKMDLLV
jgi:hypothetical protein